MTTFITQAGFERLILHYLRDKGYTETERTFVRQAGVSEDDSGAMGPANRMDAERGILDDLTAHWASSNDPAVLIGAYNRLATWADNSLDLYRGELLRVLWPVLIHCYLELVGRDAATQASALLNRYRRRLIDMAGRLSRVRAQELQELQSVAVKQHVETNRLAKQMMTSKQTVRLSSYAHEVLLHFLHSGSSMLPLLGIINKHVSFEVQDGLPRAVAFDEIGTADDGVELDAGQGDSECHAINQQAVQLGLLKGNVEDLFAEEEEQQRQAASDAVAAAAAAASTPATAVTADGTAGGTVGETPAADQPSATKKTKKAETKAAAAAAAAIAAAKAKKDAEQAERVEAQPFVPQLKDAVAREWREHLRHRAAVSRSSLPSCCLLTFINTRQTLNCIALHRDGAAVAAGFSDSSIRVTHLNRAAGASNKSPGRSKPAAGAQRRGAGSGGNSTAMDIDNEDDYDSDGDDDDDDQSGTSGGQDSSSEASTSYQLVGHTAPVHSLDYSHDHQLLLSGSADGTVRTWSTALRVPLAVYRGHLYPVWSVAACPLGLLFATGSADKTARLWSADSSTSLRIFAGHQSDVDVVRWHPNCHLLGTASSDRTVRLWDLQSGACVRLLAGQPACPTSLAFSPDGRALACGADDGSLVVWDLGSARRLASFPAAHGGPVWSLAYSHGDGAILASGGADETLRLWSNETASAHAGDASGASTQQQQQQQQAYVPLQTYRTKSSSVVALQFSSRNLLLGAGAFAMRSKRR